MFCLNPSNIAIITVKGVISKYEAIHLLANFVLDEMNIKEINIERNQNRVYNYYFDYLIKVKKIETKNTFIDQKNYKDLIIYFTRYDSVK